MRFRYGRKNSLTPSILWSFRQLIYASKLGLNALSPATSARFTPIPKVVLLPSIQIFYSDIWREGWYKGRLFCLSTSMESSWSDSKWRLSMGHKLKWSTLFFLPFPPSLIKIYRCRPEKRTGSVRKNTKLEKKGFKVVYRRWRRSYDQYGNILSHRSLKSSRWFFLLFVSFSITIHICRPHGRRAEVRKNV